MTQKIVEKKLTSLETDFWKKILQIGVVCRIMKVFGLFCLLFRYSGLFDYALDWMVGCTGDDALKDFFLVFVYSAF